MGASVAGAVLCGGASRRMGTDKALIEVDGRPLADRVARVLEAAGCAPVVLVGGDTDRLARIGRTVVPDRWPGAGPVGGVLTALGHFAGTAATSVVVVACDLVSLTRNAVHAVTALDGSLVTMAHSGRPEPMLGCWSIASAEPLGEQFAVSRSLLDVGRALDARFVAVDPGALANANTPADLSLASDGSGRPPAARPGPGAVDRVSAVTVPEIDVEEFAQQVEAGARVIDVREPDEYAAGHVPGAELIPLGTVPERLDRFGGEGPTYVICQAGGRSRRAAELAAEHGHAVVNVAGGTGAWIASGREVVTGDQPA